MSMDRIYDKLLQRACYNCNKKIIEKIAGKRGNLYGILF